MVTKTCLCLPMHNHHAISASLLSWYSTHQKWQVLCIWLKVRLNRNLRHEYESDLCLKMYYLDLQLILICELEVSTWRQMVATKLLLIKWINTKTWWGKLWSDTYWLPGKILLRCTVLNNEVAYQALHKWGKKLRLSISLWLFRTWLFTHQRHLNSLWQRFQSALHVMFQMGLIICPGKQAPVLYYVQLPNSINTTFSNVLWFIFPWTSVFLNS